MVLPPTFFTPVSWLFMVTTLIGYPMVWFAIYFISVGIYYLVSFSLLPADWFFALVRIFYGLGAVICGWLINWFIYRYWAGKRIWSWRSIRGENRLTTILTTISAVLLTAGYITYELIEINIFTLFAPMDAIVSSYQFGWEAGLNVFSTLVLGVFAVIIAFSGERRIKYDYRGSYTWIFVAALVPIWPMYGLSFTRYIPGWIGAGGEDWITQGVNLGFIGLWTIVFFIGGIIWRESVKDKSNRGRDATPRVGFIEPEKESDSSSDME